MRALGIAVLLAGSMAIGIAVLSFLGMIPGAIGLAVAPYVVHQQTKIVENSQGYIDARVEMIRSLQNAFYGPDVPPAQRAAIKAQANGLADRLRSDELPPDLRDWLGR